MFKEYYRLTKPGIVYGNAIAAIGGFFLAFFTHGSANLVTIVAMLVGLSLVIASGCVFNNYIDRNIDKKMARTKKRELATGSISGKNALFFGTVLGLLGLAMLFFFTNTLTMWLALGLHVSYVVFYSYAKRRSTLGTVVGAIPGALPPVIGYTAITNNLDVAALFLFLALACWQMPHFYSIAIYRAEEYKNANIPVLPLKKGVKLTKIYIMLYIIAFGVAASLLTFFGYTGFVYATTIIGMTLYWLYKGFRGFSIRDSDKWARGMFGVSLVILLSFSVAISVGSLLP